MRPHPIPTFGVGDLGRMTPEQEAQKQELVAYFKSQRKAIKGHKARVAAGVNKKTQRQAIKALKQSFKLGVPTTPVTPPSPTAPASPVYQLPGLPVIVDSGVPPQSTGGGGGGGDSGQYVPVIDPMTGQPVPAPAAEPAKGGGILPLALAAGALYFLA